MGLSFQALRLFLDSSGLGFEGRYLGRFWFQDGWKMHAGFCCELFFRTIFGSSVRTASWLNLYSLMKVLKVLNSDLCRPSYGLFTEVKSTRSSQVSLAGFEYM